MDLASEILSHITAYMKYAKWLPELKRKEINYVCECLKKILIETEKK